MMRLLGNDKSVLMEISALDRDGNDLLIKGKVFGTMPMTARLTPDEARKGFRMVGFRLGWFLLTLLLRRG